MMKEMDSSFLQSFLFLEIKLQDFLVSTRLAMKENTFFLVTCTKTFLSLSFAWPLLPGDVSHQNILQFLMSENSQQYLKTTDKTANGV